jgi:hypothetical protein
MELAPKVDAQTFQCFWSAPCAWGSFQLTPQKMTLTTIAGAISLQELVMVPFHPSAGRALNVTIAGSPVEHRASSQYGGVLLEFSSPTVVNSANPLLVRT